MDPQIQGLAGAIADAVEKRLSGAFEERIKTHVDTLEGHFKTHVDTLEGRFKTHVDSLEGRVKAHVDTLEERVTASVEKRLSGTFEERIKTHIVSTLEERVKTHIDEFEQRAEQRMKMHFENLDSTVTMAAEGYGGTLQKIERELVELNKKVDTKFGDHVRVLADHNQRITALEKRR